MGEQQSEQDRWNERYAEADTRRRSVGRVLADHIDHLPVDGRALDIAGGDGIEACWLALRGFHTSLIDVSDVALEQANQLASELGVRIETLHLDLDNESVPDGPWDLIHIGHFLDREVLLRAFDVCQGMLFVAIATEGNLERHARPPRCFLLEQGELARLAEQHADRFEIITCDEAWRKNGNFEAWLVARRRPSS